MRTEYLDMVGQIYSENEEKLKNYARKHYPMLKKEEVEDIVGNVSVEIIKMIYEKGSIIDKELVISSFYKRVRLRCIDIGREKQKAPKEGEDILGNNVFKDNDSGIPSAKKWPHSENMHDNINEVGNYLTNEEKILNIALSKINAKHAEIIKLYYLSEPSLSHREIADKLKISEENSKKRLSRGMNELKEYFDKKINKS